MTTNNVTARAEPATPRGFYYRTVWRWHFYAGLFCIPFVLWLACTGSIYLFRPQIEAWLDRPYTHLAISGPLASPQAQVAAAVAAVPGSRLHAYQLPNARDSAVQVLLGRGRREYRVYVQPQTLKILKTENEDLRPMRIVFRLHGALMMGDTGSMIVELAASWAIVMILTGLVLWWPREIRGLGGVVYPRRGLAGRPFWRDLHAVVGFWVSLFALAFLLSGLPWAKFWGGELKQVRKLFSSTTVQQDWTTGRSSELARRALLNRTPLGDPATETEDRHGHGHTATAEVALDDAALNRLVPVAATLQLSPPVLLAPPSAMNAHWTVRSDTQDRPRRATVALDAATGTVLSRRDFAQQPWLNRVIGTGIAAHEGQLFGALNQAMNLTIALCLITLCLSAIKLWWVRKPVGVLGAPARSGRIGFVPQIVVPVLVLGLLLPLFGASLLLVLAAEHWVLRHLGPARRFLGLEPV